MQTNISTFAWDGVGLKDRKGEQMYSIMKREHREILSEDGGEFLPTPYGRSVAPWRELVEEPEGKESRRPARDRLICK